MKTFLVLLALSYSAFCIGQDSLSIEERIVAHPFSDYDLISKGRRLLTDRFESADIEDVKDIIRYLDSKVNDENYITLFPAERVLLYYWTEEYDKILLISAAFSDEKVNNDSRVHPAEDFLFAKLQSACRSHFDQLLEAADSYHFSDDANDYLHLLLRSLLLDNSSGDASLEEMNDEADRFLEKYPDSPLCEIVKKNFATQLTPGNLLLSLYFGVGQGLTSGRITHYARSGVSFCASVDVNWKRFALILSVDAAFSKLRQEIPVNDMEYWEKGSSADLSTVGCSFGYSVFTMNNFRLTPFVGAAFSALAPKQDDNTPEHLENFKIGTSPSWMFGLNVNYSFYKNKARQNYLGYYSGMVGCLGINARFSYVPSALRDKGHQYAGNIFFMTIGVSFNTFNLKSVY